MNRQPSTPTSSNDAAGAAPPIARQSWRSWVIAGAVTAAVAVGAVLILARSDRDTTVSAALESSEQDASTGQRGFPGAGGGFGQGAAGEVIAVDGSTLTVERTDQDGDTDTITVETSGDTSITETVDGSFNDLSVGDDVVANGEERDDGTITASSITAGGTGGFGGGGFGGGGQPPEGFEPPEGVEPPAGGGGRPAVGGGFAAGEIVAIDASTFTIETSDGETVQVTAAEDVSVRVTETRSVSDIEVGDTIRAIGDTEDSVVSATSIVIGDAGFGPGGFRGRPGTEDQ